MSGSKADQPNHPGRPCGPHFGVAWCGICGWPETHTDPPAELTGLTGLERGFLSFAVPLMPTIDRHAPTIAEMQPAVDLECVMRAPWYLRRGFMPSGLGPFRRVAWRARARVDRWGLRRAMRRG